MAKSFKTARIKVGDTITGATPDNKPMKVVGVSPKSKKSKDVPWENDVKEAVKKPAKKVDLSKEAEAANAGAEVVAPITDATLEELCPKNILTRFKAAKTPAARADLLYTLSAKEWKELKKVFDEIDKFLGKLEQWFIQEFQSDQRGVTGKVGRVEVKPKEIASVEDWSKFYAFVKKKGEFDLLNKAVNQRAVQERWSQNKEVPGVGKFIKRVVSLTGVKGK